VVSFQEIVQQLKVLNEDRRKPFSIEAERWADWVVANIFKNLLFLLKGFLVSEEVFMCFEDFVHALQIVP